MEKSDDKTFVMGQLRRAKSLGILDAAMAVFTTIKNGGADTNTDWQCIRRAMDELLDMASPRDSHLAYEVSDGSRDAEAAPSRVLDNCGCQQ